jgi:DNA-directed RNA polymerase specialized sigma24 family protein
LSLRAFEEMECEEIAAVMGVPLGTVLSWIHRGRVMLRKRLRLPHQFCLTSSRNCSDGGDDHALR